MKIASAVAGYSLGEADILRRAMGKKKVEVMAEQREIFLQRAHERGFDQKKSGELFDLMAYFAGYGFNKSHSAAYALIAYQTAYLKANYPAEFMACLISLEATNTDKMAFYLQEAKSMALTLLLPDINKSDTAFSVIDNILLFGLHGIKNVGLSALENIIGERAKNGPFVDVLDFCTRIDLRTSNKRVVESLICAGAFDSLPGNRAQQFTELHTIIDQALAKKRAAETGQMGLFEIINENNNKQNEQYTFQPQAEWSDKEKLEREKEVIGFYLSAHPLEIYSQQLAWLNDVAAFDQILTLVTTSNTTQEPIALGCGLIKSRRDILTKKGDKMAFVQLEDIAATAEIIIFPKLFKKIEPWLDTYSVFIVKGAIDLTSPKKCKIKANEFVPIELFLQEWPCIKHAIFTLPNGIQENELQAIKEKLINGSIPLQLILHENGKKIKVKTKQKIALDQSTIQAIEKYNVKVSLTL